MIVGSRIESGGRGEDRLAIERAGDRVLIVVADGAGGTGSGALAAQGVCDAAVQTFRAGASGSGSWQSRLATIDVMIASAGHGGLSTAVVIELHEGHVAGASVGDSGAWLVTEDGVLDLTEPQHRKPLLGSRLARPVAMDSVAMRGRLVAATDGLFKYAPRAVLVSATAAGTPEDAAGALIDAVRMKNGRLQDDVCVVVCEGTG